LGLSAEGLPAGLAEVIRAANLAIPQS